MRVCFAACDSGSNSAHPSGGMDVFRGFRTFVNARDNEGIYIFGQTHPRKDLSCQI